MEDKFLVAAGQRRTLSISEEAHMTEQMQASIPILDIEEAEVTGGAPVKKEGRWNATRLAMVTFSVFVGIALFECVIFVSNAAKRSQSGPNFDRMAFENGLVSQARVPGTGGICQYPGTCLSGIDRESILLEFGVGQCEFNSLFDWTYPDSALDLQQRAGEVYHPPWGWARLAFHLKDLSILDGKDGWVIAYHGTGVQWIPNIMKHGLIIRGGSTSAKHGEVYGSGIYVSTNVEYSKYYAEPQCVNGRSMYPVLTCRLRPGSFTKTNMDYIWLVQSSDDIVCTGLLVKIHGPEVEHACAAPAREIVSICDDIQKDECCWSQERSARCLVVDNAHCKSATFVASDDFDGQITGCPHDAPGKLPIDWTRNGPYEELPDSIYRPKTSSRGGGQDENYYETTSTKHPTNDPWGSNSGDYYETTSTKHPTTKKNGWDSSSGDYYETTSTQEHHQYDHGGGGEPNYHDGGGHGRGNEPSYRDHGGGNEPSYHDDGGHGGGNEPSYHDHGGGDEPSYHDGAGSGSDDDGKNSAPERYAVASLSIVLSFAFFRGAVFDNLEDHS
eukprot:CAMPEP_0204248654 /NCGR_PEP_ID=MMETSP0361-20130328/99273_1 /ASSEMBLY_ACC=CAM_ASM_000343 /TAXON_ID=268821 /ORGANISM="Scrippsiella Hangoei, Strain SHTV-5" /LENGTH=555 /DNA_ID=CAMNT_0051221921 /DNA_START=18 /DNA_END=1685 /DNA_ORIENTATION=-